MRNFWLVAKHEYRAIVIRRGFLIGTLAVPFGMAILIGMIILLEELQANDLPIGYVDQSGLLNVELQAKMSEPGGPGAKVDIRAFPDQPSALTALEAEEIQAFFVLPPDYPKDLHTELFYLDEPPSDDVGRQFDDFVRLNLVAGLPDALKERVLAGPQITVTDTVNNRQFSQNAIVNIVLPFLASFFFYFSAMSASSYMLQVVADEKENRTIEIMVTSLTPLQLIGGKALGLLATSLTQLLVYLATIVLAVKITAPYLVELQQAVIPWGYLGVVALFFFPAYALIAAIMIAIGGAVTEMQQGQQLAGLLSMLFILPIFFLLLLFENPSHPVILAMTFFPTTAFLTISLRWGLSSIPFWQVALSWAILAAVAVSMVWVAARVFRAGMLRYGQPLNLRGVLAALKGD